MTFSARNIAVAGVIAAMLATLTMLILSGYSSSQWDAMQPATCLPDGCFCERVSTTEPIRQPVNTVSSLAFVLIGIWILVVAGQASQPHPFTLGHRVMLGLSIVLIGVGSAFYHASMTFVGQFFDILGMFLMTSLMLAYALQRVFDWPFWTAATAYFALNAVLTVIQLLIPETRRYIFAVVLMLALLVEVVVWFRLEPARDYRWMWFGLGGFALAWIIWLLDNSKLVCAPDSVLQGHAVWHVLGAMAAACTWAWYASEKP
jgi:dihydroceramidase